MNWKVAWGSSRGLNPADASATKVFGTEFALEAYRQLMDIVGSSAYLEEGTVGAELVRTSRACVPREHDLHVRRRHERGPARHHRHDRSGDAASAPLTSTPLMPDFAAAFPKVPLPDGSYVYLQPPDYEEVQIIGRGVISAASPDGHDLTPIQRSLLAATVQAMTHHDIDFDAATPISPAEYGAAMARRDPEFRERMVHMMLLHTLLLRPIPSSVTARVREYATVLGVDDGVLRAAEHFADGAYGLAAFDFQRAGYTSTWNPEASRALHTSHELEAAWEETTDDAELAARWQALGALPLGTLGRGVWELYRARGFVFPGLPGSAPPLLAQHDWVHVLADYGTTVENELEAFAFIARANDDPRGFSLLAMVVSLFETGYLPSGMGLFQYDMGHFTPEVAVRVADALYRGAVSWNTVTGDHSLDFLGLDWFDLAEMQIEDVRAMFAIPEKSDAAKSAGSVGPWEPGGISPFQLAAGQALAEREGREYDSHGATAR